MEQTTAEQETCGWRKVLLILNIRLRGIVTNASIIYSVVQRQLHLLNTVPDITKEEAYDIARREFYKLRLQEDVDRRIAQEEARATGAYFGLDMNTIGMELENQEYERWKAWAETEIVMQQSNRAAFAGTEITEAEAESPTAGGDLSAPESQLLESIKPLRA